MKPRRENNDRCPLHVGKGESWGRNRVEQTLWKGFVDFSKHCNWSLVEFKEEGDYEKKRKEAED